MIVRLTRSEMLERWMSLNGYAPQRADLTVIERADGVDLTAVLEAQMRQWLLTTIDTTAPRLLDVEDVATQCTLTIDAAATCCSIRLPSSVRRVISLRMAGWHADASIVDYDSPAAKRELNPLTRGGLWNPVAVREPDGCLTIRSWPDGVAELERLSAVIDHGPSLYCFDDSLLPLNPIV